MSIKKYKFISPGVFIKEIDNSQLPKEPQGIGPMVIGRTRYGRSMIPTKVESLSEFVSLFGNPSAGGGVPDVWRTETQSILAPTYASYAAMAWLTNAGPVNVVRLLGKEHSAKTTAGQAGWMTKNTAGAETTVGNAIDSGGAYGLFMIPSQSSGVTGSQHNTVGTGTLGAIWYVTEGAVRLRGLQMAPNTTASTDALTDSLLTASNGALIKSNGNYHQFQAEIVSAAGAVTDTITFNFNRNSPNYIRDVFNTDPTLTNSSINSTTKNYWLGETYERFVLNGDCAGIKRGNPQSTTTNDVIDFPGLGTGGSGGTTLGVIVGLEDPDGVNQSNHRFQSQPAQSGWFIAQNLGDRSAFTASAQPRLFKFHALESGQWPNHNLKIEIDNIAKSKNNTDPYGTFDVVVRQLQDSDQVPVVLERFSQCNLNPHSPSYLGRKVGTKYLEFSATQRRNIEYGKYSNQSRLIRVEMNADLDAGSLANKTKVLPFGVWGPAKPVDFTVLYSPGGVGSALRPIKFGAQLSNVSNALSGAFVQDSRNGIYGTTSDTRLKDFIIAGPPNNFTGGGRPNRQNFTGAFIYPSLPLRLSSSDGGIKDPKNASFGFLPTRTDTGRVFDESMVDIARPAASTFNASYTFGTTMATPFETSWIFTMDNIASSSDGTNGFYLDDSYVDGKSISHYGHSTKTGYEAVLEYGFNSFVAPMFGGFDGLDIAERDPFRNTLLNGKTEKTNYAYNSIKEAIDIVSDAEQNPFNVAVVPGVYEKTLTDHLLDTCEDRGDALAIMDLEGDFKSADENTNSYKTRVDNAAVGTVVSNLRDRNINSSYGAAYFPWVQVLDDINDQVVMMPPSVLALGTLASSERTSALWFAPAGFNRGGLSGGQAGLNVVGVTQKLTSKQRDDLYEANINPIASFPSEGIVIFGQKTLQVTPSALDRINVRRLMIFLKKRISQIANTILFDQNVQTTWNRFTGQVGPFLESVKTGLGLTDYKVVLDTSTTTPDLVDRNILYAKIFLKPARAIEYIAVDFNISRTGASFDD